MGLDADIAALPGGQELAGFVVAVQGGALLEDAGTRLTGVIGESTGAADAVRTAVARLEQSFTGAPATAFADVMAEFQAQSLAFQQSGAELADGLTSVGPAFAQLRLAVETIAHNLLFQVDQVRIARAGVAGADADIAALVVQATEAAQLSMTAFEMVAGTANGTVAAELPVFARTYSSLPALDGASELEFQARAQLQDQTAGSPPLSLTTRAPLADQRTPPIRIDAPAQPPPAGDGGSSGLNGWIDEATRILVANGVPASQLDSQALAVIIAHESSGDPGAVNTWDSNAAQGTPSIGLMQTIGSTFQAYALPGHNDIYNPVDNIIAGTRYALARYGSLDNVPGIVALRNGQPYVGY